MVRALMTSHRNAVDDGAAAGSIRRANTIGGQVIQ